MQRRRFIQLGVSGLGLSIAGVPLHALAQEKHSGSINVLLQPEPATLNLGISQSGPTQLVAANIYEGLLRYDEQLNPMPLLAASWSSSADGTVYTFKLKPNVEWHDGKPFSADDVVFSADVFLRKTHARFRSNLQQIQSIKALDPLTVEFTLKQPFGPFLRIFETTSMPILPKHIFDGTDFYSNPANSQPVGTGALKFKEWVKGSHIHLVANEKYHTPAYPKIENVYFHAIPDAASRAAAFESGKVDIAPGGSVEYFDVARLAKLPGAAVSTKGWEFFSPLSWLYINNRNAPMDQVKFRQALMYAIDREAIAKIAWFNYATPAVGPFNSHVRFFTKDLPQYPRDLTKAKALVAESGYKGQTLRLLPLPYGETWQRQAEMVRQHLTQVGIKIEITQTDVAGWTQRLSDWDYDLAFNYMYQYGDPALGPIRSFTTSNIAKGSAFNNVAGYSNPKVDALFAEGSTTVDDTRRAEIYLQIQRILMEDVPFTFLHEINFPTLYRTKVKNPISSGTGLHDSLGLGASVA